MEKEEALQKFYAKNSIDQTKADDGEYGKKLKDLSEKTDLWLKNIDKEAQEVFLTLLSEYTYLTADECEKRYGRIIELLEEELVRLGEIEKYDYCMEDVLFVTVESDSAYKSGNANVMADLQKQCIEEISKNQIVGRWSNLKGVDVSKYRVVVFIDDIIGSGFTLREMILSFYERFENEILGHSMHMFYGCLCPARCGVTHIKKRIKNKGIEMANLFEKDWRPEKCIKKDNPNYNVVLKYEKEIGDYRTDEDDPEKTFCMGFSENGYLISFYYNTPNNTLSTFWRMTPKHMNPIFKRDGNQPKIPRRRLSCREIIEKRKQLKESEYQYGEQRKNQYE